MNEESRRPSNFIRQIIETDLKASKHGGRVATRFPPEPNGYLHIGHAKSICLNFGVAEDYGGTCNLRFDDTNPHKENIEFILAIKEDVRWLGYDWQDRLYFASDYFERLYDYAVALIKNNKAYVCDLSPEEIRAFRGTLTEPGKDSPYRVRTIEENLDLFAACGPGNFQMDRECCGPRLTWLRPISTCAIRRFIAFAMASCTTKRARSGAFIPCTISPIVCRTR